MATRAPAFSAAEARAAPAIAAAGELVHQLRKASSKREGDLAKFDNKLSDLRANPQDPASARTLSRLERRRSALEDEAELLRTSLGAAEALAGTLLELREELGRASAPDAQYDKLRAQSAKLAKDNARLHEELQTKDDVIFELQEVVNLLGIEGDVSATPLAAEVMEEIEVDDLDDLEIVAEPATPPARPPDLEKVADRKAREKRERAEKKAAEKKQKAEAKERARKEKLAAKERELQAKQAARGKATAEKQAAARAAAAKAEAARKAEEASKAAKDAAEKANDATAKATAPPPVAPPPVVAEVVEEVLDLDDLGDAIEIDEVEELKPLVDVPPPSRERRHPNLTGYSHVPAKTGALPAAAAATRVSASSSDDEAES